MRRDDRYLNPRGIGQGIREEKLGAIPERDLRREQEKQGRYEWQTPLILTATLGPWFREDVSAGGTQTMRLLALGTSSTNAAVDNLIYNAAAGGSSSFLMQNPVRVIGMAIHTPSTITAGSATGAVRLDTTDVRPISDCVLTSTDTIGKTAWLGWRRGIPVAAGQTITPVIVTSSSFLPVTADISAWLFIAWQEPS
jgi:hypothetical protein